MSRWERKKTKPSLARQIAIARHYGQIGVFRSWVREHYQGERGPRAPDPMAMRFSHLNGYSDNVYDPRNIALTVTRGLPAELGVTHPQLLPVTRLLGAPVGALAVGFEAGLYTGESVLIESGNKIAGHLSYVMARPQVLLDSCLAESGVGNESARLLTAGTGEVMYLYSSFSSHVDVYRYQVAYLLDLFDRDRHVEWCLLHNASEGGKALIKALGGTIIGRGPEKEFGGVKIGHKHYAWALSMVRVVDFLSSEMAAMELDIGQTGLVERVDSKPRALS